MTSHDIADIVRRLAGRAEAVCRCYLSNGRRQGHYWQVGDVRNSPGRSMFVRLTDTAKGPAGKWVDAATAEHGDLLDVIRESCDGNDLRAALAEARRFLALPSPTPCPVANSRPRRSPGPSGTRDAARRLLRLTRPLPGTLAETYLRHRGITALHDLDALRYHPSCFYRPDGHSPMETWPAMVATVTSLSGSVTGAHRTWLARDGPGQAPVMDPKRALGDLLGHAVRFGRPDDILAVGEGIETVLSLRSALPHLPMAAALSASHLAAMLFPATLSRLYVIKDNDPAGIHASACLSERARAAGIEPVILSPVRGDFNDDLCRSGLRTVRAALRSQLLPGDVRRFLAV